MASTPPTQLGDLSNEILLLVFEELDDLNPASLFNLRLVSQRFDAVAIPLLYQSVVFDPLLIPYPDRDELDTTSRARILTNIRVHTRQVSIRSSLNWEGVLDLILSMKQFTTLR